MYKSEQCPCCDYYSLPDRGVFSICPLCFWEDDGFEMSDIDKYSEPNRLTLREGRLNFKTFGACEKAMVDCVEPVSARKNYRFEPRNI